MEKRKKERKRSSAWAASCAACCPECCCILWKEEEEDAPTAAKREGKSISSSRAAIAASISSQHFFSVVWRKTSWPDRKMSSLSIELEALRYPVYASARYYTRSYAYTFIFALWWPFLCNSKERRKKVFPLDCCAVSRWNRQHLNFSYIPGEEEEATNESSCCAAVSGSGGAREINSLRGTSSDVIISHAWKYLKKKKPAQRPQRPHSPLTAEIRPVKK